MHFKVDISTYDAIYIQYMMQYIGNT